MIISSASEAEERPNRSTVSVLLEGVRKQYGNVVAVDDISFTVQSGEFLTLLGPSGCGKTTTLRMIGGFEHPTSGLLQICGETMANRPPHLRPVNTVFQHYALFPHMTIARNIEYGLQRTGVSKPERDRRVAEALHLVRLPDVADRKPAELSGGQQQRVALARALINRPQVLLLDEPLGALDLNLRKAMQLELKQLNREVGITFIYVTHDQEEALSMSDHIAVMNEGKILQLGTPQEIYEHPSNRFVADFVGNTNLIDGRFADHDDEHAIVEIPGNGMIRTRIPSGHLDLTGRTVSIAVRPEKLVFAENSPNHSTMKWNRLCGQVEDVIYLGTHTRYVLRLPGGVAMTVHHQNQSFDQHHRRIGDQTELLFSPDSTTILVE